MRLSEDVQIVSKEKDGVQGIGGAEFRAAHRAGVPHASVLLWVASASTTFFSRRTPDAPSFPNAIDCSGGHCLANPRANTAISMGYHYDQTAEREANEEIFIVDHCGRRRHIRQEYLRRFTAYGGLENTDSTNVEFSTGYHIHIYPWETVSFRDENAQGVSTERELVTFDNFELARLHSDHAVEIADGAGRVLSRFDRDDDPTSLSLRGAIQQGIELDRRTLEEALEQELELAGRSECWEGHAARNLRAQTNTISDTLARTLVRVPKQPNRNDESRRETLRSIARLRRRYDSGLPQTPDSRHVH